MHAYMVWRYTITGDGKEGEAYKAVFPWARRDGGAAAAAAKIGNRENRRGVSLYAARRAAAAAAAARIFLPLQGAVNLRIRGG